MSFRVGFTVFGACLLGLASTSHAQVDTSSANWFLSGCRAAAHNTDLSAVVFQAGVCAGAVGALAFVGSTLPNEHRFCPPSTSTNRQRMEVVVEFLDDNPARLHETFEHLAIEAFRREWPCKP